MTHYSVYLEIAEDGTCMAHVPHLPGCVARAASREDALTALPDAIREYHAWLHHHGEPALPDEEPIEIEVAGESTGFGPFDPGDAAALFPPDRMPVPPEEMERHFQLLAYSRADLLALVRDLPDEVLDWEPDPESFTIRRILRHIGNAEKWYVSRLVPPETLPPEWDHDEDLPALEFLEMERRTAVARLRQLTEAERSDVFYPTQWTRHPDEPWTARKALRRFLEHEREHTAQVRATLAGWRAQLLANLAVERVRLLAQIVGLDEEALTARPVSDNWTAQDLLAHIAAWDELFTDRVELMTFAPLSPGLAGREAEIARVDLDARNAAVYAERRDWPLPQAVEACVDARAGFLQALARMPDEELHRLRRPPPRQVSVREWTQWRARHDATHTTDLAAWRPAQNLEHGPGRRGVLMARLAAERAGLLERLIGLDEWALTQVPVVDGWTVKDLLAHVTAWDRWELGTTKCILAGEPPDFAAVRDMDAYNAAVVAAWRDRTLAEVLTELQGARLAWVTWLRSLPEEELFRERSFNGHPWSFAHSLKVEWEHDAEHAAQIATWREAQGFEKGIGPREVLAFALAAAREELLAAAALVPPAERESRPVCGEWTLKDVLGHVADWESWCVDGLRQMAAGQTPQVEDVPDLETWNQAHAAARRQQPWDVVWRDLDTARQALLTVLAEMGQTDLGRPFPAPWGKESTPYEWARICLDHDRQHGRDLRNGEVGQ